MNEYALVTGASSGIGKQIALKLIDRGYGIIACARDAERLSEMKSYGRKKGVSVIPYIADLSCPKNCVTLHNYFARLNITLVVNCAGFGLLGDFDSHSLSQELEMISLNVSSVVLLTRLFAAGMKKGTILNVCSAAAFSPEPLMASYAASKAYVYSYSKAVNYELKKRGKNVRVALLCPGAVRSGFDARAGVGKPLPGISAEKCASVAVKALDSGKELIIPTAKIKLGYVFAKLLPTDVTTAFQYNLQSRKR